MPLVLHPVDPSIRMILGSGGWVSDASADVIIPAAQSGVGIDVPAHNLVAYAKGEDAFAVGWWLQPYPHWTVDPLPISHFDLQARHEEG